MTTMRKRVCYMKRLDLAMILVFAAFMAALLTASPAHAKARPSHMDEIKNPEGCKACHAGRGAPGTALLRKRGEQMCFECHGSAQRGRSGSDIETALTMFSRHPIFETSKFHKQGELLPEKDSSAERHVSCFDCHSAHMSSADNPWEGAKGYLPSNARIRVQNAPPSGIRIARSGSEHEMCYLCHSESANMPFDAENVSASFDPSNESFHPVEMAGRNKFMPSLMRNLNPNMTIKCTACHNNSDRSGPRGPHASNYAPILAAEYKTTDGPEGAAAYDLCYNCHDRRSVLNDESFKRHNLHVVKSETSCRTCHNSHGSRMNRHLMDFNGSVVSASAKSGGPVYMVMSPGMPKCYLSCHGVDHNNTGVGANPWPW